MSAHCCHSLVCPCPTPSSTVTEDRDDDDGWMSLYKNSPFVVVLLELQRTADCYQNNSYANKFFRYMNTPSSAIESAVGLDDWCFVARRSLPNTKNNLC